jgi:hypothetical protein
VVADSYEDLTASDNSTWTSANATGRERVLGAIATNGTYSVLSGLGDRLVDESKKWVKSVI